MFEGNSFFVTNQRCAALELRLHRVARIAVFADHLAIGADVLSIVAPEAAQSVEVTDIVGVRAPVSFHVRKKRGLIDVLKFQNRGLDRGSVVGVHLRVLGDIELTGS